MTEVDLAALGDALGEARIGSSASGPADEQHTAPHPPAAAVEGTAPTQGNEDENEHKSEHERLKTHEEEKKSKNENENENENEIKNKNKIQDQNQNQNQNHNQNMVEVQEAGLMAQAHSQPELKADTLPEPTAGKSVLPPLPQHLVEAEDDVAESPPLPKNHPAQACAAEPPALPANHPTERAEEPLDTLCAMFPALPRETVKDVYSAVGDPDRAVQVLLSFSSEDRTPPLPVRPGGIPPPTPVGAPRSVHDTSDGWGAMRRERRAPPPRPERNYDTAHLAYQPRVRKAPGTRGPTPPTPTYTPPRSYQSYQARSQPQSYPGPMHARQQEPWTEELDKFAGNASRAAEAGVARAASAFSAFKARAQALVDQQKEQQAAGSGPGWLPRQGGGKIFGPRRSGEGQSSDQQESAQAPLASSSSNAVQPVQVRPPAPLRQLSESSEADAHPVGERDLAALSRASSASSQKSSSKKDDPRAALARMAEAAPSSKMQNFGGEKAPDAPAAPPVLAAEAGVKETPAPADKGPGSSLVLGTGLGAGLGGLGAAGLAGLDDDENEDDDSDDLDYVANPFEDEE